MSAFRTLFVAIALVLFGVGVYRRSISPLSKQTLASLPKADSAWREVATTALTRVTRETVFEHRWRFAAAPKREWVTVLLIDSEGYQGNRLTRRFLSNCSYVGQDAFVVCDVELVRHFLEEREFDTQHAPFGERPAEAYVPTVAVPQERLRVYQAEMLKWVLGHELGHIANRHSAAHFLEHRFEDSVVGASVAHTEELQADAYLAQRLSDIDRDDGVTYAFLADLLNREVRRKACPNQSVLQYCPRILQGMLIYEPNVYLQYSTSHTHPEYIVRLVRLIDEAHRRYDLGLMGHINGNVRMRLVEQTASSP